MTMPKKSALCNAVYSVSTVPVQACPISSFYADTREQDCRCTCGGREGSRGPSIGHRQSHGGLSITQTDVSKAFQSPTESTAQRLFIKESWLALKVKG